MFSLAVNEPPAFGLGRGNPVVDELAAKSEHVFDTNRHATPEEFAAAFMAVIGAPPSAEPMDEQTKHNVHAQMAERWPGEAEIPLAKLAAAPFPKLVISGGWSDAFEAICAILERELGAERAAFPGTGHGLMAKGEPLVQQLGEFWERAAKR